MTKLTVTCAGSCSSWSKILRYPSKRPVMHSGLITPLQRLFCNFIENLGGLTGLSENIFCHLRLIRSRKACPCSLTTLLHLIPHRFLTYPCRFPSTPVGMPPILISTARIPLKVPVAEQQTCQLWTIHLKLHAPFRLSR